jgi:hypothetical protein
VYVFIGRKIGVALPHLSRKRVLPQRLLICHFGWEIKLLKSFEDYMGFPTRRGIYNMRKRWDCEIFVLHMIPPLPPLVFVKSQGIATRCSPGMGPKLKR